MRFGFPANPKGASSEIPRLHLDGVDVQVGYVDVARPEVLFVAGPAHRKSGCRGGTRRRGRAVEG